MCLNDLAHDTFVLSCLFSACCFTYSFLLLCCCCCCCCKTVDVMPLHPMPKYHTPMTSQGWGLQDSNEGRQYQRINHCRVRRGVASGASRETSLNKHVTPRLHRDYINHQNLGYLQLGVFRCPVTVSDQDVVSS